MRRLVLVLGVVGALLPLTARTALAQCECDPALASPRAQAAAADLVFTGTVFSITSPTASDVSILFRVDQLYKGHAGGNVTISTPEDRGSCHFDFVLSTRYTVFADGQHSTTSCSGNVRGVINPAGYGLAPRSIESNAPPDTPRVAGWVWGGIGAALLTLGVGGFLIARRYARPDEGY